MLTYGDMMTLLVTFFVLLISFSSTQASKFNSAAGSLKGALGVLSAQGTYIKQPSLPYTKVGKGYHDKEVKKIIQETKAMTERTGINEMVKITQSKDQIHYRISNPMMFDIGRAKIKDVGKPVLDQIVKLLNKTTYEVRIEGHTDNIPIHTRKYKNNWELSFARALSVTEYFISKDISAQRFQVIGYGEYRPIASNSTKAGRALNRRVEIYINLKTEVTKNAEGQSLLNKE
jgi:chemotaxis protein MotB